jgi:glycerophosphoryl diester phosphodiesterase
VQGGHDRNLKIWVNTLNPSLAAGRVDGIALKDPESVWGNLFARGVDIIQTDFPDELQTYIDKLDASPTPGTNVRSAELQ